MTHACYALSTHPQQLTRRIGALHTRLTPASLANAHAAWDAFALGHAKPRVRYRAGVVATGLAFAQGGLWGAQVLTRPIDWTLGTTVWYPGSLPLRRSKCL